MSHIQKTITIKLKVSCLANALEKSIQELKSLLNNPLAKSILKSRGVQIVGEANITHED